MPEILTRDAKQRFALAFNFLASTKNTPVDAVKLSAYFKELAGVPIAAIEATGYELGGEPSPFLPDAGTWKARSEAFASDQRAKTLGKAVQQLTDGREVEQDEITRTLAARNKFFDEYARLLGKEIPAQHASRTSLPRLPTYGCSRCRDTGWIEEDPVTTRVRRCACWEKNPVLEQRRAAEQATRTRGRGR
jgi:hypothetical protein